MANCLFINILILSRLKSCKKKVLQIFASNKKSRTFASQLRNKAIEKHRGVEQLVARWAHNPKVVCSSQASATKMRIDC